MKYLIHREGNLRSDLGKVTLIAQEDNGTKREISPERSLAVRNHSPDGFEFGYAGSGPAQLALAILLDRTNDTSLAARLYQDFKFKVISRIGHPGCELEGDYIDLWVTTNPKNL